MAVNRQKIWQINFNKYNAVGGGLKCCHPLNYKNTTVNHSPPHVERKLPVKRYKCDMQSAEKDRAGQQEAHLHKDHFRDRLQVCFRGITTG